MRKFFGGKIEPHCEYCAHGTLSTDRSGVLCRRHGVVGPGYSCSRFSYDPLLRVPKYAAKLTEFDPEEFVL